MSDGLVFRVDDLVGHPEKSRVFTGSLPVSLRLVDTKVEGVMEVGGVVTGTVDGVQTDFSARAPADIRCLRCLTGWTEELEVNGSQHFSPVPDENGYVIAGGEVDLSGPVTDEMAMGMPLAPVCRPDCRGLCPICGTDLNTDPCDGHGDDSDSPFADLKDLFDP